MTPVERLDEIEERHGDWYGQTRAGVWTDLEGEMRDMRTETLEQQAMARQIVRNDVPDLVAALRAVLDGRRNHAATCGCGACSQHKRTVAAITEALGGTP